MIEVRLGFGHFQAFEGVLRLALKGEEDARPAIDGAAGRAASHENQTLLLQLLAERMVAVISHCTPVFLGRQKAMWCEQKN